MESGGVRARGGGGVGWGGVLVVVGSEGLLAAYLSIVAIFLKPHR